jgi:hypothetical protein
VWQNRLLRAIADLDPAAGYVFLEGVERAEMAGPLWRRRLRFVSAEPAWWAPTPRAHFARAAKLDRLLAALGLEHLDLDRPVTELQPANANAWRWCAPLPMIHRCSC